METTNTNTFPQKRFGGPPSSLLDKRVLLSRDEERALILRAKTGDEKAIESLCFSVARFAFNIARRYRYTRDAMELDDLFSEAMLGVFEALADYDVDRDLKFLTFAFFRMRRNCRNYKSMSKNDLYVPINDADNYHTMSVRVMTSMISGSIPDLKTGIRKTYIPEHTVLVPCAFDNGSGELPYSIAQAEDGTHDSAVDCDHDALRIIEICNKFLRTLCKRDRLVFSMYYGVPHGEPSSLAAVGARYKLTRTGVGCILNNIKIKLHSLALKDPELRDFVEYVSSMEKLRDTSRADKIRYSSTKAAKT